ncbi:MAG: hypothetical protein QG656_2152, partial [Candidatus Hydrogenedentes bacterium]|nr:hypothetical protein [Candidatus Hydrogenedentota bacterium]
PMTTGQFNGSPHVCQDRITVRVPRPMQIDLAFLEQISPEFQTLCCGISFASVYLQK